MWNFLQVWSFNRQDFKGTNEVLEKQAQGQGKGAQPDFLQVQNVMIISNWDIKESLCILQGEGVQLVHW